MIIIVILNIIFIVVYHTNIQSNDDSNNTRNKATKTIMIITSPPKKNPDHFPISKTAPGHPLWVPRCHGASQTRSQSARDDVVCLGLVLSLRSAPPLGCSCALCQRDFLCWFVFGSVHLLVLLFVNFIICWYLFVACLFWFVVC